jgi:Lrp/AsnC family transcriptional regulator for asnA, asnC and gidA
MRPGHDTNGEPPSGIRGPAQSSELSDLDRRMIRILQSDGRRSFTDMAAELGISSRTVRRRVERLRDDGIIQLTTVADPGLLGYGAPALVGIRVDGTVAVSELASALAAVDVVDYVVLSTGRYDVIVEVLCATIEELVQTLEDEIRTRPGVAACESFPYLRLYYQQPQWDAARLKPAGGTGGRPPLALDDVDRQVIVALNLDGRASYRGIADRLGVSEGLVRQRAGRLIEAGAIRVMAITNPLSLGFGVLAWLAIQAAPGVRLEGLAERLAGCESIAYLAVCTGRFDVFAEAICTDREELLRILDTEVRALPEVARVEVAICADLRYRRLRPRFA